ncbi:MULTISPECIES: hypothetical protein [unclassified Halorhodospira]|uniref:hypothetical protein n=1 Tax=unclassified Halorhodospira TaxID=2626748 RepID=UPI001EE85D89|nr:MULTISPECIES: hypothetical protein [unclassified Halorhodospira]MCG5541873.1 hypothetical protein [Halorhodospira sp. M39old]MCG5546936.1 hypothetical protein [Halorhodospira sp. M38]
MLKKLLSLLSRQEKRRGALVLGMVVVMALLETAGVASVRISSRIRGVVRACGWIL